MNKAINVIGLTLFVLPLIADGAILFSGAALWGKRIRILLVTAVYLLVAICLPLYTVISFDSKHILEGILFVVVFRAFFLYVVGKSLYEAWIYSVVERPISKQFLPIKATSGWTGIQKLSAVLSLLIVVIIIVISVIHIMVMEGEFLQFFDSFSVFAGLILFGLLSLVLAVARAKRPDKKVTSGFIQLILITALCWATAIYLLVKTALYYW